MSSYATIAQFRQFTPALKSLPADISQVDQQAMLDAVSTQFDGYLADQFTLPLVAYTADLTMNVCYVAYWRLLAGRRGINPSAMGDEVWRQLHDDAMRWAERIADGKTTPPGFVDSAPDQIEGVPSMVTSAQRGWTNRGNASRDPGTPFDSDKAPLSGVGSGRW